MVKSVLISLMVLISGESQPGNPLDIIKQSNQEVRLLLIGKDKVDEQTERRLMAVIDKVTSFESISKKVIGRFCEKLTASQCRQFDDIFQRLLRISSLKKLGRYRADSFDYLEAKIDGQTAVVRTVAHYKEESAELNYHLQLINKQWVIVNYVMDDVDTIRNYKKQFLRLFARKTFDEVMERLKKKIMDYQKQTLNGG